MSDLKVAIMDADGNLMTYRDPEHATVESTPNSATLSIRLNKDGRGIYADGKSRPTLEDLADYFGMKFPAKQTLTESEMEHKCATYGSAYETGFTQAGGYVAPDPEPTNAEQWEKFCRELGIDLKPWQINYLSEAMDKRGVTAPGGDDE